MINNYLSRNLRKCNGFTLSKDEDNEYAMIDYTFVRAHQHSAGDKKKVSIREKMKQSEDR